MKAETKTLPSGIVIENIPNLHAKYCWFIKDTNIFHNEGEPVFEYKTGDKCWYQHDKLHRLDGPAVEEANGNKFYCINGVTYIEECYWNLFQVKKYIFLKEHPELEAFI